MIAQACIMKSSQLDGMPNRSCVNVGLGLPYFPILFLIGNTILLIIIMDTQQEIERAAETSLRKRVVDLIEALNMLRSKYQSDRRLEGAQIVNRLIDRQLQKTGEEGFYDES